MSLKTWWQSVLVKWEAHVESKKKEKLIRATISLCRQLMKTTPQHVWSYSRGLIIEGWVFGASDNTFALVRSTLIRGDVIQVGKLKGFDLHSIPIIASEFEYGDQTRAYKGLLGLSNDIKAPDNDTHQLINLLLSQHLTQQEIENG